VQSKEVGYFTQEIDQEYVIMFKGTARQKSGFQWHQDGFRPFKLLPRPVTEIWQRPDLPEVVADLHSQSCAICLVVQDRVFSCLASRGYESHRGCSVAVCEDCVAEHLMHFVEGSRYTAAPFLCPGCSKRVPMRVWTALRRSAGKETLSACSSGGGSTTATRLLPLSVLNMYLGNPKSLMTLRCEGCDNPGDLFVRVRLGADREVVLRNLERKLTPEQVKSVVGVWKRFESEDDYSAAHVIDDLVRLLSCEPGTGDLEAPALARETMEELLSLIVDVERRCTLNLSWVRRFPFVYTRCCDCQVCFKCKTSGFHEGQTCAEKQADELEIEAQYCPECGVPTIRSEGCSHMICVCGASWIWEGADY